VRKNHFFDPIATWFGVGGRGFQMDPRVIWAGRSGRSSQICDIWVLELNLRPPPNSRSYLTPKRPKNRFCRHFRAWATLPPQPKKPRYPHGPHTPPKGTQGHISGVRSALMSKMRKISIVGGFWECDCRVWYIYRYTDKQMHSY
jgi:hypothetical protein